MIGRMEFKPRAVDFNLKDHIVALKLTGGDSPGNIQTGRAWHTRQRSMDFEAVDALDMEGQSIDSGMTMTRQG